MDKAFQTSFKFLNLDVFVPIIIHLCHKMAQKS